MRLVTLALLLVTATRIAQAIAPAPDATDAEILRMLEARVEKQRHATGIVVGIVDSKGRRIIRYGTLGVDDRRPIGDDDIGLHVLGRSMPVDLRTPVIRQEVAVDPATLDRYVGRYPFSPTDIVTIARDGDRLFMHQPGQTRIPSFAYGEREFFLKIVDAQITFELAGDGPATVATWHQSGQTKQGLRAQ